MTFRASFTLDSDAFSFLQKMGGKNRSAYINALLIRERQRSLERAVLQGNREEAGDKAYREELAAWDEALEDGLEP